LPSGLGVLCQRFSSLVRDEAHQFRNQQSSIRWSGGDHSSIGDSWPIAFSDYPRGPRVDCETGCPRHTAPNLSAETRSPGRAMARTGLRMMPTFPSLPLKFRKSGFPRYGFKAGRSGRAFPATRELRVGRFASALRALRLRVSAPLCVGGHNALEHLRSSGFCRSTPGALAPVRVILSRSINA
jgi:hypothetical protein